MVEWKPLSQTQQTSEKKAPSFSLKRWVLAFLCASVGTALQFGVLGKSTVEASSQEKVGVLFARHELTLGDFLKKEDLLAKDIPYSEYLEESMILVNDYEKHLGRKLSISIPQGSALVKYAFLNEFQERTMSEKIPPGKRLYILEVPLRGLKEVLKAQDRVDVVGSLELPERGTVSVTLLENMPIVAVGSLTQDEPSGEKLAFYLSPEQIEFIQYAKKFGSFSVSLRNPHDHQEVAKAMTMDQFMEHESIQEAYQNKLFQIKKN